MRRDSLWKSPVFRILLSVLWGLLPLAAGTVLLAGLMLLGEVPVKLLYTAADILWCLGAFTAGNRAGLHGRRHGIRTGFLCGLLICGILLCGCAVLGKCSARIVMRCAMVLMAGICGGIRGVNVRITKPPY